jgi:ribosomal RNA-processing protein 12
MEEDPELAVTEKSSGTFLSGLSDCTNVTFSKVQRFWESNSAAHKEVGRAGGTRLLGWVFFQLW